MTCATPSDWTEKLRDFLNMKAPARMELARKCRAFASHAYSRDEFVSRFDKAFELAGFSTGPLTTHNAS